MLSSNFLSEMSSLAILMHLDYHHLADALILHPIYLLRQDNLRWSKNETVMLSSDIINSELYRCIKGCLSSNEYVQPGIVFSLFRYSWDWNNFWTPPWSHTLLCYPQSSDAHHSKVCGIFAAPRFNEMKPIEQCAICLSYLCFDIIHAACFWSGDPGSFFRPLGV